MKVFTNPCLPAPLLLLLFTLAIAAAQDPISILSDKFPNKARTIGFGKTLAIQYNLYATEKVPSKMMETDDNNPPAAAAAIEPEIIEMKRLKIWSDDAVVKVNRKPVPIPNVVYLNGSSSSISNLLLSIYPNGTTEVLEIGENGARSFTKMPGHSVFSERQIKPLAAGSKKFTCGTNSTHTHNHEDDGDVGSKSGATLDLSSSHHKAKKRASIMASTAQYKAVIAIDTDYDYYIKFSNTDAAINYAAKLLALSNLVFSKETNVDLLLGTLYITTNYYDDVYKDITDIYEALAALKSVWDPTESKNPRALTHLLSGKDLRGGRAYIPCYKLSNGDWTCSTTRRVLCGWYESPTNNWGYGTSAVYGDDRYWDHTVVPHELGHNFGSPHTHDYCGVFGDASPIDECAGGCCSSCENRLPGCSNNFYYGGYKGPGTIMSYCHVFGESNVVSNSSTPK
jgi:hypothetical protein